jgi:tripeptidyl-peptidase I
MFNFAYTRLLIVLCAVTAALGTPLRTRSGYSIKERHNVPRKWKRVADAPSNHVINLQIGLKQSRFDELEEHLYEGKWTSPKS